MSLGQRGLRRLALAGLVFLTLLAYLPALGNGFVWDDDEYVTHSHFIHDLDGLRRSWTEPAATLQYYPLVRTSFWLEHKLWGLAPMGYHATNILLHALNALLLWVLLRRLQVPGAWLAAALFAVHPVHVESAGWITERKNVLSAAFYLGSMIAACRFLGIDAAAARADRRPWRAYALACLLYGLALLSKTVTVTLPAALMVLLWWRRPTFGRRELRQVVWLSPMLAVGASLGALTVWLEQTAVGAAGQAWALTPVDRVLVAGRALWFYLGKLVLPYPLAFFYRRWTIDARQAAQFAWPVAFLALGIALFLMRRRLGKGPLAALLLFAGTLVPALGFFNVYPQRFSFVADHFQYLASAAIFTLMAAAAAVLCERLRVPVVPLDGRPVPSRALLARVGLPGAVLLSLLVLSAERNLAFKSRLTLWQDTVAKTPSSSTAQNNLGQALLDLGRYDEAVPPLEASIRLSPAGEAAMPHMNLGIIHERRGEMKEAEERLRLALRINPTSFTILVNAGSFFARRGQYTEALALYRRAASVKPASPDPLVGAGRVLAEMGERTSADRFYRRALELDPHSEQARLGLSEPARSATKQPAWPEESARPR
jgi:tetratricopeptide (TPR) repeat protein